MELTEIQNSFIANLKSYGSTFKSVSTSNKYEVSGTVPAMQGKKKVDGIYFASVVPKPKDIRFYFFPIYTHASSFEDISDALRKCLKGKSCFHIKKMDEQLEKDFQQLIKRGVELYQKDGLLAE